MTNRRIVASSLAGLALVALSACQGTATTTTPAAGGSTATSPTATSASSASPSKATSGSASASGSAAPEAEDAADFADKVAAAMKGVKTYKTDLQMGGGTSSGTLNGTTSMIVDQSDSKNLKAQGTASIGPVAVEMIIIGSDSYIKQPSGKYKKQALQEQDKNLLMQGVGDQFRQATNFKKVSADTVDGVPATHYSLTIPANAVTQGSPETPVEVWVDSKNRLIKQETTTETSGVKATATIKVSDYDKPVTINAPTADQIEG